ncbi:TadE family protein [Allostreptomyces psammosilenae]|uniref:TadE-like domain-containing protein n=1 Tax=Allostreptomyces psammosilenae TaxID=1892865 RepID=A0A852ZQW3_9ACTN|nr:TadE family protein [Allostreptomyces psammosilenae]NYI03244.1 hypothetical protein [Allostreptomyces psammosilenae]
MTPIVLVLTLAVVQAGLWWYARQVVLTAAREGAEIGRAYQSSPGDGERQAWDVLERLGGGLSDVRVSVADSTPERVLVTVSGRAPTLIPGVEGPRITQSASGPVERVVLP